MKNINSYECMTCEAKPKFEGFEAIKTHLQEVHNMETLGLKANKQLTMHLDGSDYYISNYKITFENGVELRNHTETQRDEDDPMRGA